MILLKAPFSGGSLGKNKGTELAPDKIVERIKKFYLNEEGRLPVFNIKDIKTNESNIEETNKNIFNAVKKSIKETNKLLLLGGDHSITFSGFKAFAEEFDNPGLVVFDAHPDCVNNFEPPTHEDYLRVLIEKNILKKENIILVGIRNWHKQEYSFLKEKRIKFYSMKEISQEGIKEVSEAVMSVAKDFDALYVSMDIDAVDPCFAPGTGHIEPGGLTSREMLYFLNKLKLLKNLKMLDLVEINPSKDVNQLTVSLGAKLLVEST
ncbi:hypothetical protein CMO89_04075 [Candidatus Woesearchaeota archaeon]|nr:hypothetical protein [Candidatus Woesearchaeota archaeon]|tara:strand:- start:6979 stop:7770 length:792 start_codon:yes stop_codon:yes gene_type:complete